MGNRIPLQEQIVSQSHAKRVIKGNEHCLASLAMKIFLIKNGVNLLVDIICVFLKCFG